MNDITKIKVNGEPESSYQLYPRNEEFAKRAGGNTGSQSGGGSVPKPLTYDYMPEGYPTKTMGTTTLMEEQEVVFTLGKGVYEAELTNPFKIVVGQTYTVNWDGTEYECVGFVFRSTPAIGNPSIMGPGNDTGEPFLYIYRYVEQADGQFVTLDTLDTSASHTISVKIAAGVITPMAEEFIPATALITYDVSSTNTFSFDLTYDELYERLLGGKQVVLHNASENEYVYLGKWKKNSSGRIDLFFIGTSSSISLFTDGTIRPTPHE